MVLGVASRPSKTIQEEQRRIAQTLHDTVSQTLTGAYLQAVVISRKLQGNGSEAAADAARLAETVHQAVVELQAVSRQLQPLPPEPPEASAPASAR